MQYALKKAAGSELEYEQLSFFDIDQPAVCTPAKPKKQCKSQEEIEKERIEKIVRENQKLVQWCMKSIRGINRNNIDEVYQAGLIGLWRAAQRFDESKGYKFSSYAAKVIRHAMIAEMQSKYPDTATLSMDTDITSEALEKLISNGEVNQFTIESKAPTELMEILKYIWESRSAANEKAAVRICILRGYGYNREQIAKIMGTTQPFVSSLYSLGKRIISCHPLFRYYMGNYHPHKVNLLGKDYEIRFAKDVIFDVIVQNPDEYEEGLCESLAVEGVGEWLLKKQHYGTPLLVNDKRHSVSNILRVYDNYIEIEVAATKGRFKKQVRFVA